MISMLKGMKKEIQALDTSTFQLVKFGSIVGGILLLLTGLALYHGKIHTAYWVGIPGILLFALGATFPRALKIFYIAWMSIGLFLGAIIGSLVLSLLYYVFVTPIALVVLLVKGNPLEHATKEGSYWIPRTSSWTKETMEQLF